MSPTAGTGAGAFSPAGGSPTGMRGEATRHLPVTHYLLSAAVTKEGLLPVLFVPCSPGELKPTIRGSSGAKGVLAEKATWLQGAGEVQPGPKHTGRASPNSQGRPWARCSGFRLFNNCFRLFNTSFKGTLLMDGSQKETADWKF